MVLLMVGITLVFLSLRILMSQMWGGSAGASIFWELLLGRKSESRHVVAVLHEIQETIESGVVPSEEQWSRLRHFAEPWGGIIGECMSELRESGASVLATLERFRTLVQSTMDLREMARTRALQAVLQTVVCSALLPLFSMVLYFLMPALHLESWKWWGASALGFLVSIGSLIWLLKIADRASWGSLPKEKRSWVLLSQAVVERFLAFLRSGLPSDLAWEKAVDLLMAQAPLLAGAWGVSIWEEPKVTSRPGVSSLEKSILEMGGSVKRIIQVCLMEGRPCSERVETVLSSAAKDIQLSIEGEISLLPSRSLQPLFMGVAPSLFGILVFALYIEWKSMGMGEGVF